MALLDEKVAIVTGAGHGIGRAHALELAKHGASVVVNDLGTSVTGDGADEKAADLTVELITQRGGIAVASYDDVSDYEGAGRMVQQAIDTYGRLDVLVNNAGIVRDAQLVKWKDGEVASLMDDATFDAVVNVNLKGVFLCTRAVVPHMIQGGGGVVLNASSIVGLYGNFGQTNYAATKAGVISFTRTWARELGKFRIRVNAVAPGFIATDMVKAMPQKVLDSMSGHTPLGILGEPADIANAYVWLASDAAKFVHGAVLSVDGGLVMGT
jgi:3-oxoacyl-[acyl-carrier protein] reductase